MMINALNHIEKIDTELITFSDDMDGLRKVPENIENSEVFKKNLGKPLHQFLILLENLKVLQNIIIQCLKQFLKNLILNLLLKVLRKL